MRGNVSVHGGSSQVINMPLTQQDKLKIQVIFQRHLFIHIIKRTFFQKLAAEDKFYRLKAIVTNNDKTETEFLSSVKAVRFFFF